MLTTPSIAYQDAFRFVCSRRLYHIWTMAMNVGAAEGLVNAASACALDFRTDGCFKGAQEESCDQEAGKVVSSRHAALNDAPAKNHDGKELSDGEHDEAVSDERLENQLRQIDDGAQPRVLLPDKVGVVDQPKHGGVGQRGLVEGLQAVDKQHDGQESPVDLAQDSLVVCGGDHDGMVGLLEQLGSSVFALEGQRVGVCSSLYVIVVGGIGGTRVCSRASLRSLDVSKVHVVFFARRLHFVSVGSKEILVRCTTQRDQLGESDRV